MKAQIHPKYNQETKVVCSCGNTFVTGSTKDMISVEVCYKCHPFFTGEHRFLDTKGRVEDFQRKQQVAATYMAKNVGKKSKKDTKQENKPKSLRELLGEV